MYCGYCGKELENSNVLICPECGARTRNDINYCTNCGGLRKKLVFFVAIYLRI